MCVCAYVYIQYIHIISMYAAAKNTIETGRSATYLRLAVSDLFSVQAGVFPDADTSVVWG